MIFPLVRWPFNLGTVSPLGHAQHKLLIHIPRSFALCLTFETNDQENWLYGYDYCLNKANNTVYAFVKSHSQIDGSTQLFGIATLLVNATSQIVQATGDKATLAAAFLQTNSQIVQANAIGQGVATSTITASLELSEQDARDIIKEEVFLTNTAEIAQLAVALNKPAYLNSLYGTIAQATHKTQIAGNQFKIKTHDDQQDLFVRNLQFDGNLQPLKEVD